VRRACGNLSQAFYLESIRNCVMTKEEIEFKREELESARNILNSVTEEVQYWEGIIKALEKELRSE